MDTKSYFFSNMAMLFVRALFVVQKRYKTTGNSPNKNWKQQNKSIIKDITFFPWKSAGVWWSWTKFHPSWNRVQVGIWFPAFNQEPPTPLSSSQFRFVAQWRVSQNQMVGGRISNSLGIFLIISPGRGEHQKYLKPPPNYLFLLDK